MKTTRRRCFTLLEILVVILILGSLSGIIGINVTQAVREQRFRSEVDLIADQLRLAQDLMLIFHANISMVITIPDPNKGYILELVPEVVLPSPWLKEVTRKHNLSHIHYINSSQINKERNQLEIKLRSGGSEMPQGTLRLSTGEEDGPRVKTRYIHFAGYPAPIIITESSTPPNTNDEAMNRELTQRTVEAVHAKSP